MVLLEEGGGGPCQLKHSVLGNHAGTFPGKGSLGIRKASSAPAMVLPVTQCSSLPVMLQVPLSSRRVVRRAAF